MNQARFRRLIAYLDGELPREEIAAAAAEIAAREDMRRELDFQRALQAGVAEALQPAQPLYSFRSLRPRLHAVDPVAEAIAFAPRMRIQGAVPRLAVAMVFLLLAAGPVAMLRHAPAVWRAVQGTVSAHEARIALAEAWAFDETPPEETREEAQG